MYSISIMESVRPYSIYCLLDEVTGEWQWLGVRYAPSEEKAIEEAKDIWGNNYEDAIKWEAKYVN